MTKEERRELIKVAMGYSNATLKLENANLVNVFSGEIYLANIYIYKKYIADIVEVEKDSFKKADKIIDIQGKYLVPGFIDSHLHIESSHLTPYHFAEAIIPKGTTTIIADPHEICNALGEEGLNYMLKASENLPMNQYFLVPSCIPSVMKLENTGAEFDADLVDKLLEKDRILGLGEVMDYIGVIHNDKRMEDIIDVAYRKNMFLQGHSPELQGSELSAYLCGGPYTCHETRDGVHAIDKIRKGMTVDARESSISKNIASIIENIKSFKSPRNLTLCTDDREPKDILEKGHINDCVRVAIKAGLEPIEAIRAVTLNTAQIYRLDKRGAIAPSYFADMLVIDNLKDINVEKVFFEGELVAENNKLLVQINKPHIDLENKNTINIDELKVEDFMIKAPIENGKLEIVGMEYINKISSVTRKKTFTVNVKDGYVDLEGDELNFAISINRYGKKTKAIAVVENFYVNRGAIATTYSHDSHNLTIIYKKPIDALVAAQRVKNIAGGIVVVENEKVVKELPFPIGGMLSKNSAYELGNYIVDMNKVLRDYGIESASPITRPSTLSLIVIPEVKLSDMGLIDVVKQEIIKQF
ncbi:adenine deaminase [Fusobacterium mortiferum]|jgi:adenine deaminase|uniref:Adenine deaminase n=1 Tax=Fusobacterium mortiferum ATCC 9817 TaxID=469616 RepID=A0ABM6TWV7_FUSMR|nr:adenine deaminase [Fusobacterium mortiferum]AVQ18714.1 adenine deaminase [Fusobacterium mortiferum ATCC 9817]EEO34957.1 adenine deaminase [Fusobacterium mortiferum ATCC 9817]MCF2627649.1 adenine deaminase [Fusobacterium mortiferum]MCF2699128.1 adenine deaminase [Fusobacterium mortiferum]MCI7188232.1 adenine deaminase [Fusobacterium mortiferum]